MAKVIPIFKSGAKDNVSNYRPISILPCFSKALDKLILKRTESFLSKNSILLPTQYGFRADRSTFHALLDVMTNTYDNISENMFTALIMSDLKKAFDPVSHDVLLPELHNYGIRGMVNDYFSSYLKDRYQFLSCDNIVSDKLPITVEAPQGSALGPLLFLLYIDDLNNCTSTPARLFADNTCILLADSNNLHAKISFEFNNINK